ncbi:MAG: aspartate aminotransferase family protein [Victivallaceae bacterium]|nr:aspartate aminotransferase family protein [Victivallaceae bacterium]
MNEQLQLYRTTTDLYRDFVMPTYAPKLLLVRGQGSYVWDHAEKRYLDFGSGISVCNLGHCHSAVTKAIKTQAQTLMHVSNLYMNVQQPRLAKKLIKHGFDGVVFFANSGAEANEGLIKFARKWGDPQGKNEIISMHESFHGRTLATLAATGRSKYREGFAPDMPGIKQVEFNDLTALEVAIDEKTAAVILEPIQGEGGVIPAEIDYLKGVRELCDRKGVLLMFDEVQCGMGRSGYFYAWQGYGVKPDALSLAKALGNGFPIGAFMVKREYAETLTVGTHASTFGGTPLACAAANAVIDTMHHENILANCQKQSHYIKGKLNELKAKHSTIVAIRMRGLMIGIELTCAAAELLPGLQEKGLLALSAGENVLRLLPPLNVTVDEIDQAILIINREFTAIEKSS